METLEQCGIDGIQVFRTGAKTAAGQRFLEQVASGEIFAANESAQALAAQELGVEPPAALAQVDNSARRLDVVDTSFADTSGWAEDRLWQSSELTFGIRGGNPDGSDTQVKLEFNQTSSRSDIFDVNLAINGRKERVNLPSDTRNTIASYTANLLRQAAANAKPGTVFRTEQYGGNFEEGVPLARLGFSAPNQAQMQFGIVTRDGRIAPANGSGLALTGDQLQADRRAVRSLASARRRGLTSQQVIDDIIMPTVRSSGSNGRVLNASKTDRLNSLRQLSSGGQGSNRLGG